MNIKHRYSIGTEFTPRGSKKRRQVIIDRVTTTSELKGIISLSYITQSIFLGQKIKHVDVLDSTITLGTIHTKE